MSLKEKIGEVFSVAKENISLPGCTVSKEILAGKNSITYFSFAENTDISAEIYPYHKLILLVSGHITVYEKDKTQKRITPGQIIVTPTDIPVGICTSEGAVYTEISIQKEDIMNKAVTIGEAFQLADLLPYQKGKIVNMDIAHNDKMKFVIMSFDASTGLSEHAAPGEAMIFALDGTASINYEGKAFSIKAGENFCFAKGGKHSIDAKEQFKMGLLLTLE